MFGLPLPRHIPTLPENEPALAGGVRVVVGASGMGICSRCSRVGLTTRGASSGSSSGSGRSGSGVGAGAPPIPCVGPGTPGTTHAIPWGKAKGVGASRDVIANVARSATWKAADHQSIVRKGSCSRVRTLAAVLGWTAGDVPTTLASPPGKRTPDRWCRCPLAS